VTTPARLRKPARPALLLIAFAASWLPLAAAYWIVAPLIGAFTLRTWLLISGSKVLIVAVVVAVAFRAVVRRWTWPWIAGLCTLAVLTAATMFHVKQLQFSPEGWYRLNEAALTALADDYYAGRVTDASDLPWRLRALSRDSSRYGIQRCWGEECWLTLTSYWNWRGLNGWGFVHYPEGTEPGPLRPDEKELGDGWYWRRVAT
jgi:hypothetical protein